MSENDEERVMPDYFNPETGMVIDIKLSKGDNMGTKQFDQFVHDLDVNLMYPEKYKEQELDVVFVVSIYDDCYGHILHKKGEDFDLLLDGPCIEDVGLTVPDGIGEGVYECSNLIVINHQDSGNPEDYEVDYDLECSWKPIWTLDLYKQNNK